MSRGNRNTIGTGAVAPVSGAGTARANRNSHPDASSLASADNSERRDLPSVSSPNFLEKLREAVSVYMGKRGDPLDRGITVRDLDSAGLITVANGYLTNPDSFNPIGSIGGGVSGPYEVDLSPPPTPTGFTATGAISDFIVQLDSPAYAAGHGHGRTNLYGATWVSGALPVFSTATKLTSFVGAVTSYPTDPATTWRLWIKWESKDGVESATPAGGVNGLAVTTAQDPSKLLTALAGQITEGQLYGTLNSRLDLIDGVGAGSVNTRIATEASARTAAITSEATSRADAIAAEAAIRSDQITIEAITRANQVQVASTEYLKNALSISDQAAATTYAISLARSDLTSNYTAGIAAEAALRTTLAATVATNLATTTALVAAESTARTTSDTAEATARSLLSTQILGADGTALTAGLIYQESLTRNTQDLALAQQITLLSAGAGEQFDWQTIWYFDTGIESWAGNGTPTAAAGWLRAANQASGAYAESPAGIAAEAAKYGQVRMRIRKTGTPTFAGWLYWQATTDSTWDVARRIALTAPTYDSNGIGLITASPVWAGTINKVRVDLSSAQTVTDYFELDWVAIGRPSPGASAAQLVSEATARATADTANASSITSLAAEVHDATTGLPNAHALITAEQTARAAADTAEASARTTLAARVMTAEGNITTNASAITTEATTRATADSTNASAITALSSTVTDPVTGLGQTRADLITLQDTTATQNTATVRETRALVAKSKQADLTALTAVLNQTQGNTAMQGTVALARQELTAAINDGISAEASARVALAAAVNTSIAAVLAEQTVLSGVDTAEATARLALAAEVHDVTTGLGTKASVTQVATAKADAIAAAATYTDTLAAEVHNPTTGLGTKASVGQVNTAKADAISAAASHADLISARLDSGDFAAVAVNANASVGPLAGLAAEYTVKLDVSGQVSGYGLRSTGTTSEFIVSAQEFAVATPASAIPAWAASTVYATGRVVGVSTDTATMLVCKSGGTSGTTEPNTSGGIGAMVYDPGIGGVTWQIASRVPFSVLTASKTINGHVIPPGMYVDGAMIVNATVNNAQIANLAVDDAKIASVTLPKIQSGSIEVSQFIRSATQHDYGAGMEYDWGVDGSGMATFNNAIVRGTVYATDGVFSGEVIARGAGVDMARMFYGNFEVYKAVPGVGQVLYKALSRVEFGVCTNAATVTIPGYFKSQPKIIVSPNSMQLYTPAYASQNQSINVSATAPVETSTGSMVWQFTPTAQLVLASGSSSTVINQTSGPGSANSWTSSTYTTVANTSSITPSVTIASNRGNGASQYFYRTVRWRVDYWNGSAWITSGAFTTVNLGADTAASATSTATFAFPSPGTWQFRIYSETYDTSTAVFGSVSYTAGSATITHSGTSSHTTYSTSGGSVSYTHTYNNGTYTPTAPWQLDPVNTYSTVYSYDYQASGGNGFSNGQGRVTDPNGQSYDTGVTRTNITLSGSATKTKVSNTDANLSFTLFADGWTGSSASGSAYVNATSAVTTVKLRAPTANSTTPSNNFTLGSYGYSLSTATVLATGSLNWIAIGD